MQPNGCLSKRKYLRLPFALLSDKRLHFTLKRRISLRNITFQNRNITFQVVIDNNFSPNLAKTPDSIA